MYNNQIIDVFDSVYNKPIDSKDTKFVAQDKAASEVIKLYEKKTGMNFQQYLRDKIVPTADEKLQRDISEELNKKEIQGQEKSAIDKVKKQGLAVDAKTLEEAEENAKENATAKGEIDLDSEVMKAVYSSMLEEYHNLRMNLYEGVNGQISTGSMTPGYKMGAKLVAYQNYLRKLDIAFKNKNGYFIAQDDDKIKEQEASFSRREEKAQKLVNRKVEDNVARVDELNLKIERIANKMLELSVQAPSMDSARFDEKMDALQSEYISTVIELEDLNPSVLELKKQSKDLEKQEEFEDRVLGTEYEKKHNRAVGDVKSIVMESANEKKADDIQEKLEDGQDRLVDTSNETAQRIVDEVEEGLKTGDISVLEADEMLQSAEHIAGVSSEINAEERDVETGDPKDDGVSDLTAPVIKDSDPPVVKECKKDVEPPEEVTKKDIKSLEERTQAVQEKINEERNR